MRLTAMKVAFDCTSAFFVFRPFFRTMQTKQANQTRQAAGNGDVDTTLVDFFAEALRLAELARERRAGRTSETESVTQTETCRADSSTEIEAGRSNKNSSKKRTRNSEQAMSLEDGLRSRPHRRNQSKTQ